MRRAGLAVRLRTQRSAMRHEYPALAQLLDRRFNVRRHASKPSIQLPRSSGCERGQGQPVIVSTPSSCVPAMDQRVATAMAVALRRMTARC